MKVSQKTGLIKKMLLTLGGRAKALDAPVSTVMLPSGLLQVLINEETAMFIQSTLSTVNTRVIAGLSMIFLGAALVLFVGFAPVSEVHNATHDTRHATGFPCH